MPILAQLESERASNRMPPLPCRLMRELLTAREMYCCSCVAEPIAAKCRWVRDEEQRVTWRKESRVRLALRQFTSSLPSAAVTRAQAHWKVPRDRTALEGRSAILSGRSAFPSPSRQAAAAPLQLSMQGLARACDASSPLTPLHSSLKSLFAVAS